MKGIMDMDGWNTHTDVVILIVQITSRMFFPLMQCLCEYIYCASTGAHGHVYRL